MYVVSIYLKASVCLALLLTFTTTAVADNADYPPLTLRFAHYVSPDLPQSKVDQWWAEEIENRSGGQIKIQFYWSETLGKASEIVDLVASGSVHLGSVAPGYFPSRFPLSSLGNNLPLLFEDNKEAQIVVSTITDDPAVQAENKKNGVWPLFWHSLPEYRVLCTKPVESFADLAGTRVRSYGVYIPMMWEAANAVGVNVQSPEVYTGLQRGNLECAYWPVDFMIAYKLYEAADYLSEANFGAIAGWPVYVNYDLWHNELPKNVKELISEVSREAGMRDREAVAASQEEALMQLNERLTVVPFPYDQQKLLEEQTPDFLALWQKDVSDGGNPAAAKRIAELVRTTLESLR